MFVDGVFPAWQRILCILCNKTFRSTRCYQLHHKRSHLFQYEHECSTCGLQFPSRHRFETHGCVPRRRSANVKMREVLASRMREKMESTPQPYFVFLDSDSQIMAYAGDGQDNGKQDGHCLPPRAEADSNSVDKVLDEDSDGSAYLQTDPFQTSDNSDAVLSCLPPCDRELLRSAADMETLASDLELDVCDTLELRDSDAEISAEVASAGDDDDGLPSDRKTSELIVMLPEDFENRESSATPLADSGTVPVEADPDVGQQWPMATLLSNGALQCNVCRKELRTANYYPHMRRVHKMPSNRSRPIAWKVCDRCGYQCQDNYKLRRHAMRHTQCCCKYIFCHVVKHGGLGRLATWHFPARPVGPASWWAATSNVEIYDLSG